MFTSRNVDLSVPQGLGNKKRSFSAKVRTGCITCKERRVKCDETKPACLRCLKWGGTCEGYNHELSRNKTKRRIAKSTSRSNSPLPPTERSSSPVGGSLVTGIRFKDERANQYFRHFQQQTVIELSGGFDTSLWSRVVLQACSFSPILQLTIATAALGCSKLPFVENEGDDEQSSILHYQYALNQYGKALKGLRKLLDEHSKDSLRAALVAALLIFCFENMLGESLRAVTNLQAALDLIYKDSRSDSVESPHTYSEPRYLLIPNITSTPSELAQPRPKIVQRSMRPLGTVNVEEEILTTFVRLETPMMEILSQSMSFPSAPEISAFSGHLRGLTSAPQSSLTIPSAFVSLREARQCFEGIVSCDRLFHFEVSQSPSPLQSISAGKRRMVPTESTMDLILADFISSNPTAIMQPSLPLEMSNQVARWHEAFYTLFLTAREMPKDSKYIWTLTQAIHACSTSILLDGSSSSEFEDLTDAEIMSHYPGRISNSTVLALARTLISHPSFTRSFVCDIGIIPSLWLVVFDSPSLTQKHAAVALLREMKGRIECVWDADVVASAAERVIQTLYGHQDVPDDEMAGIEGLTVSVEDTNAYIKSEFYGIEDAGSIDPRTLPTNYFVREVSSAPTSASASTSISNFSMEGEIRFPADWGFDAEMGDMHTP